MSSPTPSLQGSTARTTNLCSFSQRTCTLRTKWPRTNTQILKRPERSKRLGFCNWLTSTGPLLPSAVTSVEEATPWTNLFILFHLQPKPCSVVEYNVRLQTRQFKMTDQSDLCGSSSAAVEVGSGSSRWFPLCTLCVYAFSPLCLCFVLSFTYDSINTLMIIHTEIPNAELRFKRFWSGLPMQHGLYLKFFFIFTVWCLALKGSNLQLDHWLIPTREQAVFEILIAK